MIDGKKVGGRWLAVGGWFVCSSTKVSLHYYCIHVLLLSLSRSRRPTAAKSCTTLFFRVLLQPVRHSLANSTSSVSCYAIISRNSHVQFVVSLRPYIPLSHKADNNENSIHMLSFAHARRCDSGRARPHMPHVPGLLPDHLPY